MYYDIDYEDAEEFYNDSELETDDIRKSKIELVDRFLHFESDNIIDLLYQLKETFSNISPFFLDFLNIVHLSDFIIYKTFKHPIVHTPTLDEFQKEFINNFKIFYKNEIHLSYNIFKNYITKHNTNIQQFNSSILFEEWVLFCLKYTNLTEINNCD